MKLRALSRPLLPMVVLSFAAWAPTARSHPNPGPTPFVSKTVTCDLFQPTTAVYKGQKYVGPAYEGGHYQVAILGSLDGHGPFAHVLGGAANNSPAVPPSGPTMSAGGSLRPAHLTPLGVYTHYICQPDRKKDIFLRAAVGWSISSIDPNHWSVSAAGAAFSFLGKVGSGSSLGGIGLKQAFKALVRKASDVLPVCVVDAQIGDVQGRPLALECIGESGEVVGDLFVQVDTMFVMPPPPSPLDELQGREWNPCGSDDSGDSGRGPGTGDDRSGRAESSGDSYRDRIGRIFRPGRTGERGSPPTASPVPPSLPRRPIR